MAILVFHQSIYYIHVYILYMYIYNIYIYIYIYIYILGLVNMKDPGDHRFWHFFVLHCDILG